MSLGPVELLVLKFPGNHFNGEITPALVDLVDTGTIRVIDIMFAYKDEQGNLTVLEINDLDDDDYAVFDSAVGDPSGYLTREDIEALSAGLENNSSEAIMLFENTWAARFVEAVRNSKGEVVLNERIPRAVIEELVAASAD